MGFISGVWTMRAAEGVPTKARGDFDPGAAFISRGAWADKLWQDIKQSDNNVTHEIPQNAHTHTEQL